MESITAGIDLGTTSVKISIVKCDLTVIQELSSPHNATLTNLNPKQHEQNPMKICNTVMELLEKCNLSQIDQIVVTGQMHGVVLWEHKSVMDFVYGVSQGVNCSNLITWMDQRCSEEFLSSLPKWLKETGEEESKISTGYGLATLAWLQAHNQLNESWDRAGTIMDFFISLLSKNKDSFISDQNAYSWGYVENGQWTIADKHETWPIKLLPKIVTPFQNTFHASIELFGVSKETKIFVGLGDLQASILPFIQPGEAVINFGTSAQMVFPLAKDVLHGNLAKEFPHLLRVPFFDEKLLVVAASLNGGNALECFLKQIQLWAVQISNQQLNKEATIDFGLVNSILNEDPISSSTSSLKILPKFYGERHQPHVTATVQNWSSENSLKDFLQAIAKGTIQNLAELMPQEVLSRFGVKSIKLINQACKSIYVSATKECFPQCEVNTCVEIPLSAAYGAAIAGIKYSNV